MIVMETPFQMQLMYVHVIITLTKLTSEESKTLLLGRILMIKIHLFGNLGMKEGRSFRRSTVLLVLPLVVIC